jgi:hypothetical protein
MPPSGREVEVLLRIAEILREIADAVEAYARSVEERAEQGVAPAVEPAEMAQLVTAWNRVGESLSGILGVPPRDDAPRPHLTTVETSLAVVLDVVRRQSEAAGE